MTSWQIVWKKFLGAISEEQRGALLTALELDDPRLIQGATTQPPPLMCYAQEPCDGACLMAFPYINESVALAETAFADMCHSLGVSLGDLSACRYLMNYWDETPRDEARTALLEFANAHFRNHEPEALRRD